MWKNVIKEVSFGSTTVIPLLPVEESEHEIIQEEPEEVGVRVLPDTCLPCQSEIDKHNVKHIPYRSWCPFCVKGKALESKCLPTKVDVGAIPCISVDYMFMGVKEVEDTTPILTAHDNESKTSFADVVPQKGAIDFTVDKVVRNIDTLGYADVI